MFGTVLAAAITVACGGASNLSPTAPSAANPGANALRNTGNQAASPCTPPDGADVYFQPAPSGSTLPPEGQPGCDTRTDEGGGPSTHTGGTPSTNRSTAELSAEALVELAGSLRFVSLAASGLFVVA